MLLGLHFRELSGRSKVLLLDETNQAIKME